MAEKKAVIEQRDETGKEIRERGEEKKTGSVAGAGVVGNKCLKV